MIFYWSSAQCNVAECSLFACLSIFAYLKVYLVQGSMFLNCVAFLSSLLLPPLVHFTLFAFSFSLELSIPNLSLLLISSFLKSPVLLSPTCLHRLNDQLPLSLKARNDTQQVELLTLSTASQEFLPVNADRLCAKIMFYAAHGQVLLLYHAIVQQYSTSNVFHSVCERASDMRV